MKEELVIVGKSIVYLLVFACTTWFIAAFAVWDANPANWSTGMRGFIGCILAVALYLATAIAATRIYEIKTNSQ